MIDHIIFGERLPQYSFTNGEDRQILSRLSKINIFVGANNCGKSRFMRELAKVQQFPIVPHVELKGYGAEIYNLNRDFQQNNNRLRQEIQQQGFRDVDNSHDHLSLQRFWRRLR